MSSQRSLPVPDGLDGMRLDQAVSRLFGLSRTAAATLVESGDALVDGYPRPKSDKVSAGSWLEVTLPAPVSAPAVVAAEGGSTLGPGRCDLGVAKSRLTARIWRHRHLRRPPRPVGMPPPAPPRLGRPRPAPPERRQSTG